MSLSIRHLFFSSVPPSIHTQTRIFLNALLSSLFSPLPLTNMRASEKQPNKRPLPITPYSTPPLLASTNR